MVTIRSVNEIILSLIDFFRLAQPDLDTKPGTVARDLFVDAPASTLSSLYDELSGIADKQSLRLVVGSDLDKLAQNFGVVRRQATPSSGIALLTFSSLSSPVNINSGDTVTANNGFAYAVTTGISVVPAAINLYRSVAATFRDQLDFAGISDTLAVQVTVTATSAGSVGNIGPYSLNRANIPGVSNVTNTVAFNGGTDQETDAAFRNRVLSSFTGSSVGTALGYLNVALGTTGVSDAFVVQPGDPLMTRDGTIVNIANDGTRTIVSEGSGGKVDIVILGSTLVENSNSFIYQDKSNNNDPTNAKNNIVLGQIAADANKTINQKRIDDIKNSALPAQPVNALLTTTGSLSGPNFQPKSVDSLGRVFGNYELLKDTGVYGGSPFGFDTFHWISNKISNFSEDIIKGQFNGQDATTYTDVLGISAIQQTISITNENSIVTSNRSIIQLLHTPATNVTRVFNVNTGERYIITNQNFDQTGTFNTTGRIQISGNTLPSPSDLLQVDYNWVVNFDRYSDFDGLQYTSNPRSVTNSIDWGYSSVVKNERVLFTQSTVNNFFTGNTSHQIGTVLTTKTFLEVDGTVQLVTSGTFANRLSVVIRNLSSTVLTVDSVSLKNSNVEVYNTAQNDGIFSVSAGVSGINIVYTATIILPGDTTAIDGSHVTAILNSTDVFNSDVTKGSSSGNQITIPSTSIDTTATNLVLLTTYIANVSDLFSSPVISLPTSRAGNGFTLSNNNGFTNFSVTNISRRENQTIQKNLSNQFYIDISVPSSDFSLLTTQVVTVVRLSDGAQVWSSNHPGTIIVGLTGNYQLILSGFNTPLAGDRVLAIYYTTDNRRSQPSSYSNLPIKTRVNTLAVDSPTGKFIVPINNITSATNLIFSVIEPNTDIVLFAGVDGYLADNGDGTAIFGTATDFSLLPDLTNKKIKITAPTILAGITNCNNDGIYDILSYSLSTNSLIVTNILENIVPDQISIVRILDGQEIWNYTGTIDLVNNRLLIPASPAALFGDKVYVTLYNFKNLRKSPTKLVGTTLDQALNTGILTVNGTTEAKADSIVFTATNTGLKLNLSEALRKALAISSIAQVPSNIRIAKIIKVEKVITASPTDDSILDIVTTYDVKNTTIQNNLLYADDMLGNPLLLPLEFVLPNTRNNTLTTTPTNLPTLGDKIRVTFYYVTENDSENLSYTRNGVLYTNKEFTLINKMFISSGFKASQSTRFTATSFTQPSLGARYKAFYDYLAPKQNERILVRYNYNNLISTVTFNVEASRPINADVLVRGAKQVLLDLTMNVVIDPTMLSSTTTILQNLRNQLTTAMTTNKLGLIVDQATLINIAQAVAGISRARILYFNRDGNVGQVLSVQAQGDEYFSPDNVIINTETR
jgi:Baseplate J-like protein